MKKVGFALALLAALSASAFIGMFAIQRALTGVADGVIECIEECTCHLPGGHCCCGGSCKPKCKCAPCPCEDHAP